MPVETRFLRARSVPEACSWLAEYGQAGRILAGGTDLMVQINLRRLSPAALIYLGACNLAYVEDRGDALAVGATTTFATIVRSPAAQRQAPLLVQAACKIGSPAIRNAATIGGNLANASPAADAAVVLLALGATCKLVTARGERMVEAARFFTGPGQTDLQPGELLAEIIIPAQRPDDRTLYRKIGARQADACAIVSVAMALHAPGGTCTRARIALGSVAPVPLLAEQASSLLLGQRLADGDLIERVACAASEATRPIDDGRATAWYRRKASAALVRAGLAALR
jgi:CO/xanthine dehydrogenase FAD-binding subunit